MFCQINKFVLCGLCLYCYIGLAIAIEDSKVENYFQLLESAEIGFIKTVGSGRGGKVPEVKRIFNEAANPKPPTKPPKANPPPTPSGTSGGPKLPSYTPKGF